MSIRILYKSLIALGLCSAVITAQAQQQFYTKSNDALVSNGQARFYSPSGEPIHYPCSQGGEPLVIYSAPLHNQRPISSSSSILPSYVKPGYEATALTIPSYQQSNKQSKTYLIIHTINPSDGTISFSLRRKDRQIFYVDTANFPPSAQLYRSRRKVAEICE